MAFGGFGVGISSAEVETMQQINGGQATCDGRGVARGEDGYNTFAALSTLDTRIQFVRRGLGSARLGEVGYRHCNNDDDEGLCLARAGVCCYLCNCLVSAGGASVIVSADVAVDDFLFCWPLNQLSRSLLSFLSMAFDGSITERRREFWRLCLPPMTTHFTS